MKTNNGPGPVYLTELICFFLLWSSTLPAGLSSPVEGSEIRYYDPVDDELVNDMGYADLSEDVDIVSIYLDSREVPYTLEMEVRGRINLTGEGEVYNYNFYLERADSEEEAILIGSDVDWDEFNHPLILSVKGEGTDTLTIKYDPTPLEDRCEIVDITGTAEIVKAGTLLVFDEINYTQPEEDVRIGVDEARCRYWKSGGRFDLEAYVRGTSSGGEDIWIGWSVLWKNGIYSGVRWDKSLFERTGPPYLSWVLKDTSPGGDLTSFEYRVEWEGIEIPDHPLEVLEPVSGGEKIDTLYLHIVLFPGEDVHTYSEKKVVVDLESNMLPEDDEGNGKDGDDRDPVTISVIALMVLLVVVVIWKIRRENRKEGEEEAGDSPGR